MNAPMNPSGHPPGGPPMDDDLLARYQEAAELDAAQPDPNVRAAVLAEAQMQAWRHAEGMDAAGGTDEPPPTAPGDPASHLRLIETRALPRPPTRPAANDHRWPIRAVASVAVLGLAGLLALQFGRSPQTEQDVGLGRSAPSAQEGTVSDSGERVAPEVKKGDVVLYGKYAGTEVNVDGKDYLILRESDVLAILG